MDNKIEKKRNVLEEKIRIYKKNNKALCDMLTLYSYILENKKLELSTFTLLDIVIQDLEDAEIDIPLQEESIELLLTQNFEKYYALQEILDESNFDNIQLQDYRILYIEQYYANKGQEKFNFVSNLLEYNKDFASELLVSDIAINKRADFLYEFIMLITKGYYDNSLENLLNPLGAGNNLTRTTIERKIKKIEELLTYFKKTLTIEKRQLLLENIKKRFGLSAFYWLDTLQRNKTVNFMDLRCVFQYGEETLEISPYLYVSQPGCLEFYQLSEYLQFPKTLRDNDDVIILNSLKVSELRHFISFSNFSFTKEKIIIIAKRLLEYQQEKEEILKSSFMNQIKSIILEKSKNKEEYKTMCEYVELFTELSNYQRYKKELEKQQLNNARLNLLIRLNNMGKSLEKQVPEETMIRSLDFYKKISK